jgi:hypothetical protein
MKMIFMLLYVVITTPLIAQINNASYTDCYGNSESIYGWLGQNQVLVIASKGLDCSICMSHAPNVQNFADAQQGRIRVWGAMNYKYSMNVPNCTQINNWKTTYLWNNIFMFIDSNDDWEGQGYPTYYVISPFDSSIIYEGVNWNDASGIAIQLADSLGLNTNILNHNNEEKNIHAYLYRGQLYVDLAENFSEKEINISVMDITGKQIINSRKNVSKNIDLLVIPVEQVRVGGIYMLHITGAGKLLFSKKLLVAE